MTAATKRARSAARTRIESAARRSRAIIEPPVRLHPQKTRIVYCQDGTRRGSHEHTSFPYRFTFRARGSRTRHGKVFAGFGPAISKGALGESQVSIHGVG